MIWADAILVMEDAHRSRLLRGFRGVIGETPVHVLDIPDDYRFMDPDLVDLLKAAIAPVLEQIQGRL